MTWLCCAVGRDAGICGIGGVFGWKCAARDCAQISSSEMANRIGFIMAPQETALQHREVDNVRLFFFLSSSVWTTVKAQRDKISSWSARFVSNVIDVERLPRMEIEAVETLTQNWTVGSRTATCMC